MKRVSKLLLALFILSLAVGAAGAELARWRVQEGLSRFLGIPVRVQRLTFSPRRLTLHGVSFLLPVQAPLKIDRLNLEGSILSVATGRLFSGPFPNVRSVKLTGLTLSVSGVPLRAGGEVFLRGQPGAYAQVDGLLTLEHPMLKGSAEITGRLLEPVLFGWIESAPVGRRHFIAQLDISREAIGLPRMLIQDGWTANGSLIFNLPAWRGEINVAGPDLQRCRFQIMPAEGGATRAMLTVQPEGAPPKEFSVKWLVRRGRLDFEAGLMGRQAVLKGQSDLRLPYRTAVRLDLNGLDLEEIREWIPNQSSSKLSGALRGQVEVNGILGKITSKGELIAGEGKFGRMDFERILIRFQGKGPVLRLENSYLTRRGAVVQMEGMLDARRLGRRDFFRNVKLSSMPGMEGSLDLGSVAIGPTPGAGVNVQTSITAEQNVKVKIEKEDAIIVVEHRKKF